MARRYDFDYGRSQIVRIGELARRVGLRPSALRYYEGRGVLAPPRRVSGRREYGADAVNSLKLLLAAQDAGFTLAEARSLLGLLGDARHGAERWREMARRKLGELESTMERLEEARRALAGALDCPCAGDADRCTLVSGTRFPRVPRARGSRRSR
jgi:MerR family redox-sensitive transcriptional activator SoxR